jgi:hypothetical protein
MLMHVLDVEQAIKLRSEGGREHQRSERRH